MRQIYPDLWLNQPYLPAPDELPELTFHAFKHDEGNILFYTGEIPDDYDEIAALGGVKRHLLSHDHEAGPGLAAVKERFGSTLHSHRDAEPVTREHAKVDDTFDAREQHPDGIEAISCPGHTAGSACYPTRSSEGRTYLFIGDTIYPAAGGKFEALVDEPDRPQFFKSVELLRTLEPDVVLFGASMPDEPFYEVTPETWQAALDEAVGSLDSAAGREAY